jgi:hypothetical protein
MNIHALSSIRTYDPGIKQAKKIRALDHSATIICIQSIYGFRCD